MPLFPQKPPESVLLRYRESLKDDDQRAKLQRAFKRLDAAISHHRKQAGQFATEADEALYHAQRKVYEDFGPELG